jgi:ribose 5-phosphate isomerase B
VWESLPIRGAALTADLVARLHAAGRDVVDLGADGLSPDHDRPDVVLPRAGAVAAAVVSRGGICGSGVGASIRPDTVSGIRAVLIQDNCSGGQGVEGDHMNPISVDGHTAGPGVAWNLVQTLLAAEFSHARRHLRRPSTVAFLELQPTRTNP